MRVIITDHRDEIAALCEQTGVRRLDLFGSATTSAFDESTSDVDFLVEFDDPTSPSYVDAYFTLKEGLECLLERPVDLVTRLSIQNPHLRRRVETTKELLYQRPSVSRGVSRGCSDGQLVGRSRGGVQLDRCP